MHYVLRIFNIVNQSLHYQVNIEVRAEKLLNNTNSLHALKIELSSKGKIFRGREGSDRWGMI